LLRVKKKVKKECGTDFKVMGHFHMRPTRVLIIVSTCSKESAATSEGIAEKK
jgi:hypothetical protein